MDLKVYLISTFLIVLVSLLDQSTALECYWCNSNEDNNCDITKEGTHLVNCNEKAKSLKRQPGNFTLCRKMVITLPDAEKRIVRTCGYTVNDRKYGCYYTATRDVKTTTCECFDDGCNGAPSVNGALVLLFSPLLVSFLGR